jgi:hypothetical protein
VTHENKHPVSRGFKSLNGLSQDFAMRGILALLTAALLLITTHRLPAPIQEVPQTTPTPTNGPTTPKKASIAPAASAESPTAKAKTKRFAGTWTGIVPFKDPFANGGGNQQCDFIVNDEENSLTIRVSKPGTGSYRTATTRLLVIGNTATGKGGLFKHMNCMLTLIGDGNTATVVVRDTIWGTSSGTVKKMK